MEISPEDKAEDINRTVQFLCSASGIPTPQIIWYKEGERLNASNRIVFHVNELNFQPVLSLLNIHNTMASDSGLYSCVAQNQAGRADSSFHVTINGRFQNHC